jgi:hypothetical protein
MDFVRQDVLSVKDYAAAVLASDAALARAEADWKKSERKRRSTSSR